MMRESPPAGAVGIVTLNSKLPYIKKSVVFAVTALNLIFPPTIDGFLVVIFFK
jgi:ABC-type molybdate transport system permease subunit